MEITLLCTANVYDFVSIMNDNNKKAVMLKIKENYTLFQWNLNKNNEHEPNKHNYVNKSVSLLFYQSCVSCSM